MNGIKKLIHKLHLKEIPTYQYFYLIMIIILLPFIRFSYDNDFWFTINQGRYFLEKGIPNFAINSIHDITCIYQSYGSSIVFYLVYHYLGDIGMLLLMIIIAFLTAYFFYKLCFRVSDNQKLSLFITFIVMAIYDIYLVTRPHIFTILNLVILLYLMESYLKTKKKKYLIWMPLISLLQVNMHGIYFIVLLIILCPYLINSFKFKITDHFTSSGYAKKEIWVTYLVMFLTGFINPFGYKTIIYGFNSYSASSLMNNTIIELNAIDFHEILGKIFIFIIILTYILYIKNKKKIPIRYYLLLFGTTYLAMDAKKSFYFFLICSLFPLAYLYGDQKSLLMKGEYSKSYHLVHLSFTIFILGMIILNIPKPKFPKIDKYVNYLEKEVQNKEETKIYSNLADGSYLEYRGYYCYMDPRAEIFLKENNHQFDYYKEYDDLQNLKISHQDFLDKYRFDYMLISRYDTLYYLMNTYDLEGYEKVMEDDKYMLLKLKGEENAKK